MIEITNATWHGFACLKMESELLRVILVPNLGGKIVSLLDKVRHYEWLVPPMRPLKQTTYGSDFVSQDMSGWDEMLPTIVSCTYQGAILPDHGEVWSIPWQVELTAEAVILSVKGVAMPYQLIRSAAFIAPDCLELSYQVVNTGQRSFPYLWAAHPQFIADESTRVVLPPQVTSLVNVIQDDPAWGASGTRHPWPQAVDRQGHIWRLDRVRPIQHRACRKFYIPPEQQAAWAALVHEGKGCQLQMEWSPSESPYLGLWVDEGSYNSLPVVAFEPSNAYYDSLLWAIENNRVSFLEPGQEHRWQLRIRLSAAA